MDKGSLNLSKLKKKSWYKHYDSLQQRVNLSVNEKDKDPESIGLKYLLLSHTPIRHIRVTVLMSDRESGVKSVEMQNPAYRTGAKPLKVLM